MAIITKIIADFQTRLQAKISVGGTSGEIKTNLDSDGEALPTGYYFLTLDGDNSSKEYIYCLLTGTAMTEIYNVSCQGVKTSGTKREHRFRCLVEITNFAQIKLLNDILGGNDTLQATTPLKYDTTPTISNAKHIGTKAHADSLTVTPQKASTSVIGASRVSYTPADALAPILLGHNDPRVPTQDEKDAMAGSYGTPGAGNKFATADNSGLVNNVLLTTDQNVSDVKTFGSIPVMPGNPTTDNQMANLAYVNSL